MLQPCAPPEEPRSHPRTSDTFSSPPSTHDTAHTHTHHMHTENHRTDTRISNSAEWDDGDGVVEHDSVEDHAASVASLQAWLVESGFSAVTRAALAHSTFDDVWCMSKSMAKQMVGVKEGIRLYNRIQIMKQSVEETETREEEGHTQGKPEEQQQGKQSVDTEQLSRKRSSGSSSSRTRGRTRSSSTGSDPVVTSPCVGDNSLLLAANSSSMLSSRLFLSSSSSSSSVTPCPPPPCTSVPRYRCSQCRCCMCLVHASKSLATSAVYCQRCSKTDCVIM